MKTGLHTGLGIRPLGQAQQATRLVGQPEAQPQPQSDTLTLRFAGKKNAKITKQPKPNEAAVTPQTVHYLNDIPYKTAEGTYQMVVEIPSGTNEKWQTDPTGGGFYHDKQNGIPRVINFLPYPFNYGFVPQTVLPKEKGGDGDPLDAVILAPGRPRGEVMPMRVIGALKLAERGETDTKIVAIEEGGPFQDVQDIPEMLVKYPGALEIVRLWFEGYKGPGSFLFEGYALRDEALSMIEEAHQDFVSAQK